MKLTQRVNFILLPVILGVFALGGSAVFQAIKQKTYDLITEALSQELASLNNSFDFELRTTRSALGEVLNSAELVGFLNSPVRDYQVFVFEEQLFRLLKRARQHSPQLEMLQVRDPSDHAIVNLADGDPFEEPALDPELKSFMSTDVLLQRREVGLYKHLYSTAAGVDKLALIQRFNPALIVGDVVNQSSSNVYTVVLVKRIDSFLNAERRLAEEYGPQLTFEHLLVDRVMSEDEAPIHLEQLSNGEHQVQLNTPYFQVHVSLPMAAVSESLAEEKAYIVASALGLTFFSFFMLQWLIRQQIVGPIDTLVEKIRSSKDGESFYLQPMQSGDEVAELNNAYLSILKNVQQLASNDHLTGLANRHSFNHLLARQLRQAQAGNHKLALLYIDLDNFKRVNDHYGHATGDRLLVTFSERLAQSVRPANFLGALGGDSFARLAGDEFALLLTQTDSMDVPRIVAERVLSLFQDGFEVDGIVHNVQASIGIAVGPDDGAEPQSLLKNADAAMYQAKQAGRNRYQFFNSELSTQLRTRQRIESTLKRSLERGDGFELVYMPIYETTSLALKGAEVLLRCPVLTEAGIGPDKFIPIAESTGQIKQIDLWVIEQAFIRMKQQRQQCQFQGRFAVNISAVELHNDLFPEKVRGLLDKHQVLAEWFELELTETSLVNDDAVSVTNLHRLKELGFTLSLDDFGTGYTAFNQLASYPVDTLKIDRSFINDMHDTQKARKQPMVDIILSLAELYKLSVVAEGVETKEQLDYLQGANCHQVQGYYLSKPLGEQDWRALLHSHSETAAN